jgi:hypothetical protein
MFIGRGSLVADANLARIAAEIIGVSRQRIGELPTAGRATPPIPRAWHAGIAISPRRPNIPASPSIGYRTTA